jgi:hypothetical protein
MTALHVAAALARVLDEVGILAGSGLVVLAVGAGSRHFQALRPTPIDDRIVHERSVVVEVDAAQRKRKQLPCRRQRLDHQLVVADDDRNTFRPAGRDVGQDHCLHKTADGRGAGMRDKIDLGKAGRRSLQSPIVRTGTQRRTAERSSARREPFDALRGVRPGASACSRRPSVTWRQ